MTVTPTSPPADPGSPATVIDLPSGSYWSATFDHCTGDITNGVSQIPSVASVRTALGFTVPIISSITDVIPATGHVDSNGNITLNSSFKLSVFLDLGSITPGKTATCEIHPIDVPFTGGPLSGDPQTASLSAAGFTVPEFSYIEPVENDPCAGLDLTLDGILGLPTSLTSMDINIVQTDAPIPTTTTTAPATPATVAADTASADTLPVTGTNSRTLWTELLAGLLMIQIGLLFVGMSNRPRNRQTS